MKDLFDMITDVRSLINVPAFTSLIDGKVYPSIRPDNSTKVDSVVNGLSLTQTQQQIGSGNINIYVPKINSGGALVVDQSRMSTLSKIVANLIKAVYMPTFRVFLDSQAEMIRDTDGSYYVTVRFKYYSFQDEQVEV